MSKQVSLQQQQMLVSLIEYNPKLKTGKLDNSFTFKDKKDGWIEVSKTLNAIAGSNKDPTAWEKCWKDMMRTTRDKCILIKDQLTATGNKERIDHVLTPLQERVEAIIGAVFIGGHTKSRESPIGNGVQDICDPVLRSEVMDLGILDIDTGINAPNLDSSSESTFLSPLATPHHSVNQPNQYQSASTAVDSIEPSYLLKSTAKSRKSLARKALQPTQRPLNRMRQPEKRLTITEAARDTFYKTQEDQLKVAQEQLAISKEILKTKQDKAESLKVIANNSTVIMKLMADFVKVASQSKKF